MSHTLTFLDKTFWITESADNPKHVGSLQILEMPSDAEPSHYLQSLLEELRGFDNPVAPFNCVVKTFLGYPVAFKPIRHLNMDYHVQMHQLDDIHDSKAVDEIVANMHSTLLDADKPLWQLHLLHDGVSKRYAAYLRIHHMCGDGATLVKWFQSGYSTESSTENFSPIWAIKRQRRKRSKPPLWRRTIGSVVNTLQVVKDMIVIIMRLNMRLIRLNRHYMPVPFTGTKTVLTGQVKSGRAVATMDIDWDRVKKLGKKTRASANEVLLCAFDIGVHRLLQDYGHSFKKALLTNVPINLRKPGDNTGGNKIAIVPVQLAHGEQDPYLRLRQIIYHHRIVKHAAQHANPASFSVYTIIIQSIALVLEWCRISDYVPPIANILISNVPGPNDERYFKDSRLLASYPVSAITPGGGVNITLMTYGGKANIGMVCSNQKVKDLHPLAGYMQDAFDLLERSVDDPNLSIEDIGEHEEEVPVSIVDEVLSSHSK